MSNFIRIQRNERITPKKTIVNLLLNYADKHYELIIYSTRLTYASILLFITVPYHHIN